MKSALKSAILPLAVFATNLAVCRRYFRTEYSDQLQSIEGVFISFASYIQRHWPAWDWFPMWFGGMPFARVYQPALHYAVAALSRLTGASVPSAYHALTAITYSLGGVAFYFLAKALTRQPIVSFCGAMLFSLFSPSTLLVPAIRADAGGIFHPRRLQALIVYGEGPNVTGLTLAIFALAAIHIALRRRTVFPMVLAGVAVAAVPATSWPATMALVIAMFCYVAAMNAAEWSLNLRRMLAICLLAIGFALPFALPSTIVNTFEQANIIDETPTHGAPRWISFALLFALMALVRFALRGRSFAARFVVLWSIFAVWLVVSASSFGVRLITNPLRFHLAMEIPLILAAAIAAGTIPRRPGLSRSAPLAVAAVLIFCAFQFVTYRRFPRARVHAIDIAARPEYQMAKWADANMHGGRIYVRGSFGFWLNVFTETPQVSGFFDPSLSNPEDRIQNYVIAAGYSSDRESADYSLLWLKAWAADAIEMGGPNSADFYKDYAFPYRFRGVLPVLWSRGDDYVYRVPERTSGLARAVRIADLVRHPPVNGIDVTELRPFVEALDDPSLPVLHTAWQGTNAARISGTLTPDDAISLALNYDSGWTAKVDNRPAPLHADGLGLIALEPGCSGPCQIDLSWSAGPEPWFAIALFLLAALVPAGYAVRQSRITHRPPFHFRALRALLRWLNRHAPEWPAPDDAAHFDPARLHNAETALRALKMPDADGDRYLAKHIPRLAKTLALVPPPQQTGRALELGCYMQITPLVERLCGYREVRGAYYGPEGRVDRRTYPFPDGEFVCYVDHFDVERNPFPYPDDYFDLVVAGEIIEHMTHDPMWMLLESRRVLAEGGYLLISTPNVGSVTSAAKTLEGRDNPQIFFLYERPGEDGSTDIGHVREYTCHELGEAVRAAGFEVELLFTTFIGEFAEHKQLLKFLALNGYSAENRGEQTWCLARKRAALPVDRYPWFIYTP